jgi:hypothetical protein
MRFRSSPLAENLDGQMLDHCLTSRRRLLWYWESAAFS